MFNAWRWTSQITLRITIEEKAEATALKLEGRIAGPWVAELSRTWAEIKPQLKSRKLSIDLRGTTYADIAGLEVLRAIYAQGTAELMTSTPWTQYLAEEITRQSANVDEEL